MPNKTRKRKSAAKPNRRNVRISPGPSARQTYVVERVQTGVRMEKRLLKVLKALAEFLDMTLGDLLESVVLHSFEGKRPFQKKTMARIDVLRAFYELDLDARAGHNMIEAGEGDRA